MENIPLSTEPFSFGEVILHLDSSENLKKSFEAVKAIIPKGMNFQDYTIYKNVVLHEKGAYFGIIQRAYEEMKDARVELDSQFKNEVKGHKEYRPQTVAFYEACLAMVAQRERLFSEAMEYCGFVNFVMSIQQRKLDEFYKKGIDVVIAQERLNALSDKTAELTVMLGEAGITSELVKDKVMKVRMLAAEKRAEAEAYEMDIQDQEYYKNLAKICEKVQEINKNGNKMPTTTELIRTTGIRQNLVPKMLKLLTKIECLKRVKRGTRSLFEFVRKPTVAEITQYLALKRSAETTPIRASERESESGREETVENVVPFQSEGVIRGEETGEVPDEEPEEDKNDGEEFGRT